MIHIVKRRGHTEPFDERKAYASIFAACRNVQLTELEAEMVANQVSGEIKSWSSDKRLITAEQIFEKVKKELYKYNKDASFMYETHRDIS